MKAYTQAQCYGVNKTTAFSLMSENKLSLMAPKKLLSIIF